MAKIRRDWYFQEWLRTCEKRAVDLVTELEWNKSKVSLFMNGKQDFKRKDIYELADYLAVKPFELLMPPETAFAFRRFQANALEIVSATDAMRESPEGAGPTDDISNVPLRKFS